MAAVATLKALLKLDNKQYKAGMRDSTRETQRLQKSLGEISRLMASAFSVAAVYRLTRAVVSAASKMEDLRVQFEGLGLSTKQAAQHMRMLRDFATSTPFQLEDIAKMSQQLFVLSEGALGGAGSLKLFGDAAAATGSKDLAGLAYWIGRLYASLKSNRPIVDALNALQRLKMVSPTVMQKMIQMKEGGASASEMWDVFTGGLTKFEGAMKKLESTTSGKTSTMKDAWTEFFAVVGEGFEGATKKLIEFSTEAAKRLPSAVTHASETFAAIVASVEEHGLKEGLKPENVIKVMKRVAELRAKDRKAGADRGGGTGVGQGTGMTPGAAVGSDDEFWKSFLDNPELKGLLAGDKKIQAARQKMVTAWDREVAQSKGREKGITGSGITADSMARVGGMVGPGRMGLGSADRQLRVQQEQLESSKRLEDIVQNFTETVAAIEESVMERWR